MPVRLKLAFNQNYAVSGMTFDWTTLFVKVANLAFDKQVDLVYSPFGSSAWFERPLGFVSHHGNYDVFGSDSVALSSVETFALRYRVAGASTGTTTSGRLHHRTGLFRQGGGHVSLRSATAFRKTEAGGGFTFDTGWFEGEILVDNLAFNKRVGVAYTRDGGTTWNTVTAATSARPGDRSQRRRGRGLEVQDAAAQHRTRVERVPLRRVLRGDGLGVTYWDNNFGQDYFLSQTAGSTLA